jgi:hypothetical protein
VRSLIIFFIFATPAFGQNALPKKMIYAMNALQEEVTVCEAYYAVVGRCVEEDADLSKQMQSAEDVLEKEAVVVGKSIGMTNDAISSRFSLFLDQDMSLMNNSCVNLPSLLTRHADRCKIVVEHPQIILNEYLNK